MSIRLLLLLAVSLANATAAVDLVREGTPVGQIVVGESAPPFYQRLADSFAATVERSTGARLPVVREGQEKSGVPRLYVGPTHAAEALGLKGENLEEETYRIRTDGDAVYVVGRDAIDDGLPESSDRWRRTVESEPTRWGLNKLLEDGLGVRWLWPGPLGTYVPHKKVFSVPTLDVTYRPTLRTRRLSLGVPGLRLDFAKHPAMKPVFAEAYDWMANHQGNYRTEISVQHAFNDWWEKYGKEHPDWFVQPLAGQPFSDKPYHRKLRFTNPEVIEQIAKEYTEAGAPKYWTVSENDGAGFDVSDEARALDLPPNQPVEDIWTAKGNLTARYVTFWNRIYDRLKQINPDVTLVALAYSCYQTPPPAERPLTAKMIIGMVCSYRSFDEWKAWRAASNGSQMVLRPNWGWIGANAPHLPLKQIHEFMQFASREGLLAFQLDSILGYWGTQGPNYYVMARMATRPDLSFDQVVDEYTSAFGAGAGKIREYLDYWQKQADENGYPVSRNLVPGGKYERLREEGRISDSWFLGPREAMVDLYPDTVLNPAYELLAQAEAQIGESDPEARERVKFLRSGLDEMRATRDLLAMSKKVASAPDKESVRQFTQASKALDELRLKLTPGHAIWGDAITGLENKRRLPVRPTNLKLPELYDGEDQ